MKLAIAGLLLLSVSAFAQSPEYWATTPKVEVFTGYSFLHFDTQGSGLQSSANGWTASARYNPLSFLGVEADASGHYNKQVLGIGAHSYSYLFGPVVFHEFGPYRPFAHVLFGVNNVALGESGISVSQNAFATAFGGGFDVRLNRWVAIRVAQADYLVTHHNFGAGNQKNFRASTGLIFEF